MLRRPRVGSEIIDEATSGLAISEFAAQQNLSKRQAHQLILSHATDRHSAAGWVQAIAKVTRELQAARQRGDILHEHEVLYPAFAADGPKLALSRPAGNADVPAEQELRFTDPAMADAEAARILGDAASRKANRSIAAILAESSVSSSTSFGSSDFALSRSSQGERLYDDALIFTSPVTSQAELDQSLVHLARSGKEGATALGLVQGDSPSATGAEVDSIVMRLSATPAGRRAFGLSGPDRTDDVTDSPDGVSTSDLSQRVSYQAAGADRLAPRLCETAQHLVTDPDAKFCPACGSPVVSDEPGQDPATAGRQVAAGIDVQAEVDRLGKLAVADTSGNRSDPPKSRAVRDAETARARPGHT